jgi:hypothetical protein
MSRTMTWAILCVTLVGLTASWASAQQIFVGGDPSTMKMDIYLRDADIPEALTALFNTTDGKYQLKLDPSVVGRISRLQLTATPFEQALDAILGTEYSYTKRKGDNGTALYTITGRNTGAAKPILGGAMNAPPADDPVAGSAGNLGGNTGAVKPSTGFPTLSYFTKPTTTGTTGATGAPGTTAEGEAATEELSVVKMIGINYLDLEAICEALGGTTIALFDSSNYGGGGTNNSGGGGSRSSRNNNNNNNNDNYDNNNNNNNNNNTNTRTTRTSTRTNNTNTNNNNY